MKDLKDLYKVDLEDAFNSIIDCDGGKPDYDKPPSYDTDGYPKCVLPMSTGPD